MTYFDDDTYRDFRAVNFELCNARHQVGLLLIQK